jgi:hypothetical protein
MTNARRSPLSIGCSLLEKARIACLFCFIWGRICLPVKRSSPERYGWKIEQGVQNTSLPHFPFSWHGLCILIFQRLSFSIDHAGQTIAAKLSGLHRGWGIGRS